jgi:threonine dehydrogenase-like Zn-dependent dehydrogenase
VKIPEVIKEIAVLTEPMSIAAKAIDEALAIQQARLKDFKEGTNWLDGKKALVVGLGPIGLMAAFALRLKGATVSGMDIVDAKSLRPKILEEIGGKYVDGRIVKATDLDDTCGEWDYIFEATGIAKLQIELIDALAFNGILITTGIAEGDRPITIAAGNAFKQLVLKNQVILGSVNASMQHYENAVSYLVSSLARWPDAIKRVITEKVRYKSFQRAFDRELENEIKIVVDWSH